MCRQGNGIAMTGKVTRSSDYSCLVGKYLRIRLGRPDLDL